MLVTVILLFIFYGIFNTTQFQQKSMQKKI